jgi:hypothetical protein
MVTRMPMVRATCAVAAAWQGSGNYVLKIIGSILPPQASALAGMAQLASNVWRDLSTMLWRLAAEPEETFECQILRAIGEIDDRRLLVSEVIEHRLQAVACHHVEQR